MFDLTVKAFFRRKSEQIKIENESAKKHSKPTFYGTNRLLNDKKNHNLKKL